MYLDPWWVMQKDEYWEEYEASPLENYFMPFLPESFYEVRWALMRYNPLCWTPFQKEYTLGEFVLFSLIVLELIGVSVAWAAHPDFRADVTLTGPCSLFAAR